MVMPIDAAAQGLLFRWIEEVVITFLPQKPLANCSKSVMLCIDRVIYRFVIFLTQPALTVGGKRLFPAAWSVATDMSASNLNGDTVADDVIIQRLKSRINFLLAADFFSQILKTESGDIQFASGLKM